MSRISLAIFFALFVQTASAQFEPKSIAEVRAGAFRTMQACLTALKPKERALPPTCAFMDCDIKVRSCWIEGAQAVTAEIEAIQRHVEQSHFKDRCDRAFLEFFDFPTPQDYLQLQQRIRGERYEWELPPKWRGNAAILTRLVDYELVLTLYNTECR